MDTEKQNQNDEHRGDGRREKEEALLRESGHTGEEFPPSSASRRSSQGHEATFSGSCTSQLPPRPPSGRHMNSPQTSFSSRGVSPVSNPFTPVLPFAALPPPYAPVDDMSAKEVLLHNGPARPRRSRESLQRTSSTPVRPVNGGPDVGEEKKERKYDQELAKGRMGAQETLPSPLPVGAESSLKSVHVVREEKEVLLEGMTSKWSCGDLERPVEEDFLAGSTNIDANKSSMLWNEEEATPETLEEQHSQERRSRTGSFHKPSASQDDPVRESMMSTEDYARVEASRHEVHSLPRLDKKENEERVQVHEEEESERGKSERGVTPTETALEQLRRCAGQQREFCAYPYSFPTSAGPYSSSFRPIPGGCTVYSSRKTPAIASEEVAFKRHCDLFRNRAWQHSNGDSLLPPKEWLRARRGNRKTPDEIARQIPQSAKRPSSVVEEKVLAEIFEEKKPPRTYLLVPTKPKKCVSEQTPFSENRNGIYQRPNPKRSSSEQVEQHVMAPHTGAKGNLFSSASPSGSHLSSLSGKHVSLEARMSPVTSAVYGESLDDPVLVLRVVDHSTASAPPS